MTAAGAAAAAGYGLAESGAFDSQADFDRDNVLAGLAGLRHVPVRVDCGSSDPFAAMTQLPVSRLQQLTGRLAAGGISAGCHDDAYWARSLPAELQFPGRHLD
jgi:hypothetical protein